MDLDKGTIEGTIANDFTHPTQNSNRTNHQDDACGNALTNTHKAKLTIF